jgi:hypothetical protein
MFNTSWFELSIYVGVKNSRFLYATTFTIYHEDMWIN